MFSLLMLLPSVGDTFAIQPVEFLKLLMRNALRSSVILFEAFKARLLLVLKVKVTQWRACSGTTRARSKEIKRSWCSAPRPGCRSPEKPGTNYLYSKTNYLHQCMKFFFILEWQSTCFGRPFCPSFGVQDCTHSNRHLSNRYCCSAC